MLTGTVEQAYAVSEEITREQARNFYYGIRLLPAKKRAALCAVYALARRIDDIGDGQLPTSEKFRALREVRVSVEELARGGPPADPVLTALADSLRRYPIPLDAFGELLDGVEMDLVGRRYATFADLVTYCRCVAGSVGRLCLGIFGSRPDRQAVGYADDLGIALQQTNILRDIREDLLVGRVYLPEEDLDRFGVDLRLGPDGALVDADGALSALIRHSCVRAGSWYERGEQLVPLLDRRSAACCLAMSGIYHRLTDRIAEQPRLVLDRRLSLSGREKAAVAARALAGRPA